MREIKFEYIFKSGKNIEKKIYSLELLEVLEVDIIALEKSSEIIARRQYTGLKDKNGKEIYEGDIVNVYRENLDGDNELYDKGEIWYMENCGAYGYGKKEISRGEMFIESELLEIIGNIYENSVLLSKE